MDLERYTTLYSIQLVQLKSFYSDKIFGEPSSEAGQSKTSVFKKCPNQSMVVNCRAVQELGWKNLIK